MSTTTTDAATSTKTFRDFGVDDTICDSLEAVGITEPFPIQEMTLPLALSGADIIGQARTGTGKTLGFGLPMLQRIDTSGGLQVLVIVPTRELCIQVTQDLAQAGKGRGVDVLAVYGGKAIQPQIDALAEGVHLVVGTPGRLLDLSRRGVMDLSHCHGLVLDEADEMLDLGFLPDVEALIEMCAEDRQTLLFSATMPAAIVSLARRYMTKPTFMRAEVEEITIAPATKQYFFSCHRMDKPAVLARILQTPNRGLCLVFCRTKRMADTLAEELNNRDVNSQAIHSDLRQEARERALQRFRDHKITVLCATEVAARGLDIDDVTHVVNYDCPDDEKMYLHRIGRTGRAGEAGVAITLAVWNELPRLEMIRRELDIDEEIHEVFSTSPLLDELFDLPTREEREKVPSPTRARSGKGSKSRRRAKKGDSDESSGRTRRSSAKGADTTRSTSREADGDADGKASSAAGTDDSDDGIRQTRTRRRRRTRTKTVEGETTVAEKGPSRDDGDRVAQSGEDVQSGRDGDEESSRGRTRTRQRPRGRPEDTRADRSTEEDQQPPDGRRTQEARSTGRSRDRDRSAAGRGDGSSTDTRVSSTDGEDRSPKSRSRGSKRDSATDRDAASDGGSSTGRDSSTGPEGGSRDRNRSNRGGRRSREDRGNGRGSSGGRGSGGGRSSGGGRVDADDARGDGTPRLSRKLEVTHLP